MTDEGDKRLDTKVSLYCDNDGRGSPPTGPSDSEHRSIRKRLKGLEGNETESDDDYNDEAEKTKELAKITKLEPQQSSADKQECDQIGDTDRYFRKPLVIDDEEHWGVSAVREFEWVPTESEVKLGYFDEHSIYAGLKFASFDEAFQAVSVIASKGNFAVKKKNEPKRGMFVIVCSRSGNPETQYKRKIKRRQEKRDAKKQFRTRVTSTLVCNCAYRVRLAHCEPPEGETGVPFQRGVEYHGWIQITMTCFSHNHECEPNPKPVRTVKVPTRRVLGCTENGANNISPLKKLAISDMRSTNPLGWESHGSINGIAAVDPIQSAIQSHPTSLNRVPEPEPHAHQIAVEQYQRIAHQITAPLEGGILYVEGKRFRVRPTPVTVAEGDSGIRVLQYALSSRGHDYTKQQIRDILSNCQNPTWLECTQTFVFNFNIDQWRQGMKGHAPLDDMGMLSAIFEFGLNMVLYSCRKNSLFCDLRVLSTALDQRLMSVAPESLLTSDKSTLPYHDLPVFYEPGLAFHVVDRDIDSTLAPEECWRVPSRKQVSLW